MVNILTRIVRIILMVVVVLTASLYLLANADQVLALSQTLLDPVLNRQAVEEGESYPLHTATPRQASAGSKKASLSNVAALEAPDLPLFLFEEHLADLDPAVEQLIFILAEGSEANLWMIRLVGERWYTEAGPLYCRIGQDGISPDPGFMDRKTVAGWSTPHTLYLPQSTEDIAWRPIQREGEYLTLTLTSWDQGIPAGRIVSGGVERATNGFISLSEGDMLRLCKWLNPDALTLTGVFPATEYGWTIEAGMPDNFVFLSDVASGVREDTRYAGRENFMGRPLDGYSGNRIVVLREVALALQEVQARLEAQGLGLLVYDGYRPARAVENVFSWMRDPADDVTKADYYPSLAKKDLKGIYLAEYSPHTRGIAVDLTVCDLQTGEPLDMGTGFDFFAPASWYASREVTADQRQKRKLLRDVMLSCNFEAYDKEWWHFNFSGAVSATERYDFIIPQ